MKLLNIGVGNDDGEHEADETPAPAKKPRACPGSRMRPSRLRHP